MQLPLGWLRHLLDRLKAADPAVNASNKTLLGVREIVQDGHFVAALNERNSRVGTDKAVSTFELLEFTASNQSREYSPSFD